MSPDANEPIDNRIHTDEIQENEEESESRYDDIEFNSFNEMDLYVKNMGIQRNTLKIVLLTSEFNDINPCIEELGNFFIVTGEHPFYKIESKAYKETSDASSDFTGYIYMKSSDQFILLTISPVKDLEKYVFTPFLKRSRHIIRLWISQSLTHLLMYELKNKYNAIFKMWAGEYDPVFNEKSKIRPDFKRKIKYEGNDSWESYEELKDYGCVINRFSILIPDFSLFSFNQKFSLFKISYGDLTRFREIIDFIYENSEIYMKKVKGFKKNEYISQITTIKTEVSNNLCFTFASQMTDGMIEKLLEKINENPSLKTTNQIHLKNGQDLGYWIKIFNLDTKGSFDLLLNHESANFYQVYNANYAGCMPIIHIIDNYIPKSQIYLVE
jgi:hypothetical protein